MAKWEHLALAPCRHQRLPASLLQAPHLPLAEDTACGKAEGSGYTELGGSPCYPIHSPVDSVPKPREDSAVLNTGLYWW